MIEFDWREHDTPSTAHTEAERRWPHTPEHPIVNADWEWKRRAFTDGAEWVLAQVREGLEALERELLAPVPRYGAFRRSVIELRNEGVRLSLAVVDRLEGKQ